jgi:hypothetical protein
VNAVVTSLEPLRADERAVCRLLAGAAPRPGVARCLRAPFVVPLFAMTIPEKIVPCAEAASVLLVNVEALGSASRHRIGSALPVGIEGGKDA